MANSAACEMLDATEEDVAVSRGSDVIKALCRTRIRFVPRRGSCLSSELLACSTSVCMHALGIHELGRGCVVDDLFRFAWFPLSPP